MLNATPLVFDAISFSHHFTRAVFRKTSQQVPKRSEGNLRGVLVAKPIDKPCRDVRGSPGGKRGNHANAVQLRTQIDRKVNFQVVPSTCSPTHPSPHVFRHVQPLAFARSRSSIALARLLPAVLAPLPGMTCRRSSIQARHGRQAVQTLKIPFRLGACFENHRPHRARVCSD